VSGAAAARRRRAGSGPPAALLGLLLVIAPGEARAHLVSTGLGPFYDGLGHFLLTPEDLLTAAALALLVGLSGPRLGRAALFALPAAWLAGGLAGLHLGGGAPAAPPALTALALLGLGALVATDRRLPPGPGAALAVAVGLIHGHANGTALGAAGLGAVALTGIGTGLFVMFALVAALVVSLRRPWTRIAVRVAGSWIAASGLLLLGWTLRDGI
jgi:urease accessory protein